MCAMHAIDKLQLPRGSIMFLFVIHGNTDWSTELVTYRVTVFYCIIFVAHVASSLTKVVTWLLISAACRSRESI